MGKKRKANLSARKGTRTRLNPLTGQIEEIPGPKAGKKRYRCAPGDPLRTHDLHGSPGTKGSKKKP